VVHDALDLQALPLTVVPDLTSLMSRLVSIDALRIDDRNRLGLALLSRGQGLVIRVLDVLLVCRDVPD